VCSGRSPVITLTTAGFPAGYAGSSAGRISRGFSTNSRLLGGEEVVAGNSPPLRASTPATAETTQALPRPITVAPPRWLPWQPPTYPAAPGEAQARGTHLVVRDVAPLETLLKLDAPSGAFSAAPATLATRIINATKNTTIKATSTAKLTADLTIPHLRLNNAGAGRLGPPFRGSCAAKPFASTIGPMMITRTSRPPSLGRPELPPRLRRLPAPPTFR
jgi:hypothetical protein